ncbi:MAG: DUF1569 domain-containing protein [Edaphobacter sp.]
MNPILQTLQTEIASALNSLDAAQTQLRPPANPGKWSIQQIIEHLLLTYSASEAAINARIAKRSPTKATPSLRQRVQQYAVLKLSYLPTGRPAPPAVTPPTVVPPRSGRELTQATHQHLSRIDVLSTEAKSLFGDNQCASHMVLGPLSADQWRMFQLIHGRHHLKQIAAIRKAHNL